MNRTPYYEIFEKVKSGTINEEEFLSWLFIFSKDVSRNAKASFCKKLRDAGQECINKDNMRGGQALINLASEIESK